MRPQQSKGDAGIIKLSRDVESAAASGSASGFCSTLQHAGRAGASGARGQ